MPHTSKRSIFAAPFIILTALVLVAGLAACGVAGTAPGLGASGTPLPGASTPGGATLNGCMSQRAPNGLPADVVLTEIGAGSPVP